MDYPTTPATSDSDSVMKDVVKTMPAVAVIAALNHDVVQAYTLWLKDYLLGTGRAALPPDFPENGFMAHAEEFVQPDGSIRFMKTMALPSDKGHPAYLVFDLTIDVKRLASDAPGGEG